MAALVLLAAVGFCLFRRRSRRRPACGPGACLPRHVGEWPGPHSPHRLARHCGRGDSVGVWAHCHFVRSTSQEGLSIVSIEFWYGTDMMKALFDIQSLMNVVQADLPSSRARPRPRAFHGSTGP